MASNPETSDRTHADRAPVAYVEVPHGCEAPPGLAVVDDTVGARHDVTVWRGDLIAEYDEHERVEEGP